MTIDGTVGKLIVFLIIFSRWQLEKEYFEFHDSPNK